MFKNILVATDGSDHARTAISVASRLAAQEDAQLELVHVQMTGEVPPALQRMVTVEHMVNPSTRSQPSAPNIPANIATTMAETIGNTEYHQKIAEAVGREILETGEKLARDSGATKVKTSIESGDPAQAILKAAERNHADLIVVGSRGFGNIKGLVLGSVSDKVAKKAPCNCITVK